MLFVYLFIKLTRVEPSPVLFDFKLCLTHSQHSKYIGCFVNSDKCLSCFCRQCHWWSRAHYCFFIIKSCWNFKRWGTTCVGAWFETLDYLFTHLASMVRKRNAALVYSTCIWISCLFQILSKLIKQLREKSLFYFPLYPNLSRLPSLTVGEVLEKYIVKSKSP